MAEDILLKVENLKISADSSELVHGLDFQLKKGKTLAIVGESGSGKSLSSLAIMGLLAKELKLEGSIIFDSHQLVGMSMDEHRKLRGRRLGMIFQEPMTALNPTMKCGAQVSEVLRLHKGLSRKEAKRETLKLFEQTKLPRPTDIYDSYPHEISGGQKQRVMIAMAISCKPDLLIADEPTTALDATVQKEILDILKDLKERYEMGMIFISHDLGVVEAVADEVLVIYRGERMEYGPVREIFAKPKHDYTRGLLACRPSADTRYDRLPLISDFLEGRPLPKERSKTQKRSDSEDKLKNPVLFKIRDLRRWFPMKHGGGKDYVKAADEVSLEIHEGESLGLVGESGSGKTTIGRILSGLEKADSGELLYNDADIASLSTSNWKNLHKEIQIIFQDPFSSLNPRKKIGPVIREVIQRNNNVGRTAAKEEAIVLLHKVGLDEDAYNRYPHEFSGGQRQRIGIARALAVRPRFIVCDESVSALDVSVQAQILNLLNDLKDEYQLTYLFISHDLAVVRYFCDRIAVLKSGKLVESGFADALYEEPQDPYTQKLIASVLNAG